MNKLLAGWFVAGTFLALAAGAFAAESGAAATTAVATHPAAELAALEFLVGSFSCTGTWHNESGERVAKSSRITTAWKLDRYFLGFEYEQPRTREQPNQIKASGYFGWDLAKKKYVHSAINNQGLTVTLYAEPGDALVFKADGEPTTNGAAPHGAIFTFKKAARGFTISTDLERAGKLQRVSEETCTN